jgi:hypothetical protein
MPQNAATHNILICDVASQYAGAAGIPMGGRFKAAPFDAGGKKVEGMSPPWLQARICEEWCWFGWFGLKPVHGTQRFLPLVCTCRALDRTVSEVFRQGCLAI